MPTVKTVQIERGWDELQTSAEITRLGLEAGLEESGGKVRVALDCTGFESSIRAAIYVSRLFVVVLPLPPGTRPRDQ